MDYTINSYLSNNSNEIIVFPGFIYDNKRFCSKLYLFFKFIGLIFYTISLINCYSLEFYIIMIISMSLSTKEDLTLWIYKIGFCLVFIFIHFIRN